MIYDEFVGGIVDRAESYDLGPGTDDPGVGPLNHEARYDSVLEYVDVGVEEGATLATGGGTPDREGYFVEPTVFTDVDPDMRIAREEIFGPVLTVIPYSDREEAVEIANGVECGLAGGVFSQDIDEALAGPRRRRRHRLRQRVVRRLAGDAVRGHQEERHRPRKGPRSARSSLQTKSITVDVDG